MHEQSQTDITALRGTNWRCVSNWKDHGGVDGVEWGSSLEFQDKGGSWHCGECWSEEHRGRSVPFAIRSWFIHMRIRHCPSHSVSATMLRCPVCRVGMDEMRLASGAP